MRYFDEDGDEIERLGCGTPIKSGFADLPMGDLNALLEFVIRCEPVSPELAEWLLRYCSHEKQVRASGGKIERELPQIPTPFWTNSQVADALEAIQLLSYHTETEELGVLVREVNYAIAFNAAARLRHFDKLSEPPTDQESTDQESTDQEPSE